MALHPELSRIVENFHMLRGYVAAGEVSAEEATVSLEAFMAIDGEGYEWRLNASGVFTRSVAGGVGVATDPGLFAAAVLPELNLEGETNPFPYSVTAGEEAAETAKRWNEIKRSNTGSGFEKDKGEAKVGRFIDEIGSKLLKFSKLVGLRVLDSSEAVLREKWGKIVFWAVLGFLTVFYVISYS